MTNKGTLVQLFLDRVSKEATQPATTDKSNGKWVAQTWGEWNRHSKALASAMIDDSVTPFERVAIFAYTRREWVEADMATLMNGSTVVTIYQNVGRETACYILDDSEAVVVFVEGPLQLKILFGDDGKLPLPKTLRRIVYMLDRQRPLTRPGQLAQDEVFLEQVVPKDRRELLISHKDYILKGEKLAREKRTILDARIANLQKENLAKIIYTSGTTGQPKGVMLSHENLTSVVEPLKQDIDIRRDDVALLFLPLAHVYAQLLYHAQLRWGFKVAFAQSMLTAVDDAEEVKPDFFISVPRMFEKIHAGALMNVNRSGIITKKIFNWATSVGHKVSNYKQHGYKITGALAIQSRIAEKLVFSKIKKKLGGRLRFVVSGGAPLSKSLAEFFHAADLLVLEGYGMTENGSLSNYNKPDNFKFGTVGMAPNNMDVQIADDGEILVHGPNVMMGYLNKPEETAKTIDNGGWLHTGDIGTIDEDGFLTITDRKKDLIVTSGGKNIAPAPIEAKLLDSQFVSQSVVLGDSKKYLVALLTLDQEYANHWAANNGITTVGDALAADKQLRAAIEQHIQTVNTGLESYETIKDFALLPNEFSLERGEITPSLKLRRRIIERRNHELIESMYSDKSTWVSNLIDG